MASLLSVEYYVSAPIVLFVIFKLLVGKVIRDQVCPHVGLKQYMLHTRYGNIALRSSPSSRGLSGCTYGINSGMTQRCSRRTTLSYVQQWYVHSPEWGRCKAAYLLWAMPLLIGILCFFYGIAAVPEQEQGAVKMIMFSS